MRVDTDLLAMDHEVETQPFGCVSWSGEWSAPSCPGKHFHSGEDIAGVAYGTPVYTTRAGTIVKIGIKYLGDWAVGLRADPMPDDPIDPKTGKRLSVFLIFGHLRAATVRLGQHVEAAAQVGELGGKPNSGQGSSSGPHLHFAVRTDGPFEQVDPSDPNKNILNPRPWFKIKTVAKAAPKEDDMLNIEIPAHETRCVASGNQGKVGGQQHDYWLGLYADSANGHTKPADVEVWFNGPDHPEDSEKAKLEISQRAEIGKGAWFVGDHIVGPFALAIHNNSDHLIYAGVEHYIS